MVWSLRGHLTRTRLHLQSMANLAQAPPRTMAHSATELRHTATHRGRHNTHLRGLTTRPRQFQVMELNPMRMPSLMEANTDLLCA